VPTYETLPRFTPEQRRKFRQTVAAFVEDLRAGGRFRAGLRVKRVQRAYGIYELTWYIGAGPAGRATWQYGPALSPNTARDLAPHRHPQDSGLPLIGNLRSRETRSM